MKSKNCSLLKYFIPLFLLISAPQRSAAGSGILTLPMALSQANGCSGCCFPSSGGWDNYIVITNNFLGPNATNIINGMVTNTGHFTNLLVSTCAAANGTNLVTGIIIQNIYIPSGKVCATNDINCGTSTNLSTATISMSTSTNTSVYKATVYFKSATTNGLSSISVNWTYSNP